MLYPHRVTFEEYRSWGDEQRREIIDGVPYLMSPAPSVRHQEIVGAVFLALRQALAGTPCRAYVSPIDVKLSEYDCVQPDLVVICDPAQNRTSHLEGPPALVVEVLSPSTRGHDRLRKLRLYARSGIPEYWIIDPDLPSLEILQLQTDHYTIRNVYDATGEIHSATLPTLHLSFNDLFTAP